MEEEEGGGVEHPAREYVMRKLEEGGGGADRLEYGLKPTECNCKSTKCLKLYCECFLQSRFCGRYCLCRDCGNTPDKIEEVCWEGGGGREGRGKQCMEEREEKEWFFVCAQ